MPSFFAIAINLHVNGDSEIYNITSEWGGGGEMIGLARVISVQ